MKQIHSSKLAKAVAAAFALASLAGQAGASQIAGGSIGTVANTSPAPAGRTATQQPKTGTANAKAGTANAKASSAKSVSAPKH